MDAFSASILVDFSDRLLDSIVRAYEGDLSNQVINSLDKVLSKGTSFQDIIAKARSALRVNGLSDKRGTAILNQYVQEAEKMLKDYTQRTDTLKEKQANYENNKLSAGTILGDNLLTNLATIGSKAIKGGYKGKNFFKEAGKDLLNNNAIYKHMKSSKELEKATQEVNNGISQIQSFEKNINS